LKKGANPLVGGHSEKKVAVVHGQSEPKKKGRGEGGEARRTQSKRGI